MKKLFAVLFVLAIGLTAQANTVTYTDSVTGLFDEVPDTILYIPQFDPSLGTLNSITMNLSTAIQASFGYENLKKFTGGTFNVSTNNIYGYLVLGLNGSGIIGSNYSDNQTYAATVTAYDGTTDYAGTSGKTVATFSDADTQTITLSDAANLALFTGTGNMNFTTLTDALNMFTVPANSAAIINTTGQASTSVTYDYTPIPEPATIAFLSLCGLFLKRKKIA